MRALSEQVTQSSRPNGCRHAALSQMGIASRTSLHPSLYAKGGASAHEAFLAQELWGIAGAVG